MTERTRYSREYKEEAVRLVVEQGIPASQAARDLGINGNMLRHWIREYEASSGGHSQGGADPDRNRRKSDASRGKSPG